MRPKKQVKLNAIKEAEQIFMKTRPYMAMKTGNPFPKVDRSNMDTPYAKEALRMEKQIVKMRLKQFKDLGR
jgi:hypothetical protein